MPRNTQLRTSILTKGENISGKRTVTIDCYPGGIEVFPEGCGVFTSEPHTGAPIYLEHYEGKFQLLVWADINQEDPTHIIDLSGARESEREE